jgi:hypothetical protein
MLGKREKGSGLLCVQTKVSCGVRWGLSNHFGYISPPLLITAFGIKRDMGFLRRRKVPQSENVNIQVSGVWVLAYLAYTYNLAYEDPKCKIFGVGSSIYY